MKTAVLEMDQQKVIKQQKEINLIYLLTDFSDHAKNACEYALDAFGLTANYVLINSFVVRTTAATLIDIEEMARQESCVNLEAEADRLRKLSPGVAIESWSKSGSVVAVVNKLIKDFGGDLVVVGSKGISKLDEILIGSVTNAVMRGVKKPVLAVPLKAKFKKMDQIVLASDLINSNKKGVISVVDAFKKKFNSYVSAISIKVDGQALSTEEKEILQELEQVDSLNEISIVRNDNVGIGLMDYCENTSADLLIMVAKHTSFFKRFFHKSITKELVNHEVLPILVLEDYE